MQLYRVSGEYYNYIKQFDSKVPYLKDDKKNRPFVGIVLEINEVSYYAPLTSPKPKHKKMKNAIDFEKIDGGVYGAINFNNMIPVPDSEVVVVDTVIAESDTKAEIDYKNLLVNQLSWCQKNETVLINKAANLRRVIDNPVFNNVKKRCCDFELLEEKCREYEEQRITFDSVEALLEDLNK